MKEFDFKKELPETKWLVENLIPIGHLCFVLAHAGVGKSLLLEALAISLVYDIPFGGLAITGGDVLIIDQDTPESTLDKRLINFGKAIGKEKKHKFFVESMKGYTLSEKTLQTVIGDYPSVVLVVVDSLHSVCGRLNPNFTSDMSVLSRLKSKCLNNHNTIMFNHHISEKEVLSVDDLMIGDTGHLAMGNSAIIQQADTYYIVGATASEGRTNKIYVRPVSKRVSIPTKPVILRLLQNEDGEKIEFDGYYDKGVSAVEQDILVLFREQNMDRTVKETYEAMGHRHGEIAVRKALSELDNRGMLIMSKHKSNLFKYKLP